MSDVVKTPFVGPAYKESEMQDALRQLYDEPTVALAVDTETTGLRVDDKRARCIGISFAGVLEQSIPISGYLPTGHPVNGETISKRTYDMVKYVLQQEGRPLVWANVQFDVLSLETINIFAGQQEFYDILTIANTIDENTPITKSVAELSKHYLHEQGKLDEPWIKKEKTTGWPTTTAEQMWPYAVADAVTTWRIWDQLMQHQEWLALPPDIWTEKQKLIRVITEMRRRGILIDQDLCIDESILGDAAMAEIKERLGMNPGSRPQLEELLINQMGLPIIKVSKKTGLPSFDKDAMFEYDLILERRGEPQAKLIKAYRGWQKAVSASYRPYVALVSPDGRLRCTYNTHRTTTGRLSSSEPNLQQIPKESDKVWNGKVKQAFLAKPGFTLVEFDYSQLELRLATAYANEAELKEIFAAGRDIFTEMGSMLGMARQDTKTLVYSMNYGAGIKRIKNVFGVTDERAKEIRQNYFDTYPRLHNLNSIIDMKAKGTKRARLWSGRYRHLRYASESYKAFNSVIQGGAADIVERVMVRLYEEIDNENCRMLLQVHDSIVWEIRDDLVQEYIPLIKDIMEHFEPLEISTAVTFAVEATIRKYEDVSGS